MHETTFQPLDQAPSESVRLVMGRPFFWRAAGVGERAVRLEVWAAVGLSGAKATQQFKGTGSLETDIGNNQDTQAPILEKAHLGIVGDAWENSPQADLGHQAAKG